MNRFRVTTKAGRIIALGTIVATASGCGESGQASQADAAGGPADGGPPATSVEVTPVERGSIARSVTVSGVVEPIRIVGVNSQLSGALLSIHAEEGDPIERGAVLAELDSRELRAQIEAAEAAFDVAEAAFERAEQLRERRVITVPEYERERTAYAAARAELDQLRTRLDFATVNAPTAGVVTEKHVEAGDVVAPQTRLFTLADVSTLVVRVGVSELDVVELEEGDPVDVGLDAYPGRALNGEIRRIFPSADPGTRLVPVEVALGEEAAAIARPGFLARTTFSLRARDDVLLIPAGAIVRGSGSNSVFVVDAGTAVRRTVSTGLTSEGRVEVTSGLQAGDGVVTAGQNMLRDGMEVRVVGTTGAPSDAPASQRGIDAEAPQTGAATQSQEAGR